MAKIAKTIENKYPTITLSVSKKIGQAKDQIEKITKTRSKLGKICKDEIEKPK